MLCYVMLCSILIAIHNIWKDVFKVSKNTKKNIAKRKSKIINKLKKRNWENQLRPMLSGNNIHYDVNGRHNGISCGGIGIMHQMVHKMRLPDEINSRLESPWSMDSCTLWPSWTCTAAEFSPGEFPNTLEPDFCVDAIQEALSRYGRPEIFNTDQGAQFTSNDFVNVLRDNQIAISMDGRGRCQDNIFIERLWWTIKHQYLYLRSIDSGSALRTGLGAWIAFYNHDRAHSALDNRTPDEAYYGLPHPFAEAA